MCVCVRLSDILSLSLSFSLSAPPLNTHTQTHTHRLDDETAVVLQILDAPDAPDLSASDMNKTLLLEVRRWGVGEDGKEKVSDSLETRVPRQFTGVRVEGGGRASISSVKLFHQ
jgi:hypothetical protein